MLITWDNTPSIHTDIFYRELISLNTGVVHVNFPRYGPPSPMRQRSAMQARHPFPPPRQTREQQPPPSEPPFIPMAYRQPFPRPNPLISAFRTNDGNFDYNKLMAVIDQTVKVAQQVSPLFTAFRKK
ncbi:YppG family protein [Fictibacillus enclensis]|uniref:YppG family protein n=1 Tax=Fictibacillus enclensis TaxID=1017270 RepID=UPI00259FE8A2|nr:YppG family protein [Fictibacillus enclensis]